jgi:hypothetical protein
MRRASPSTTTSSSSNLPTSQSTTASAAANTTIANKKLKTNIGGLTQFLRQFLKKSFSMTDLQLKPYRTDEYIHKLFYETARFSAFNHQWIVKSIINNSQRDVHQVSDRHITYQVSI